MAGFVYFLADPRAPRWPRYVGATKDVAMREREHAKRATSSPEPLYRWKESLRAAGLAPKLVVIREFDTRDAAFAAEWRIRARLRRRGLADLNCEKEGRANAVALAWSAFARKRGAP